VRAPTRESFSLPGLTRYAARGAQDHKPNNPSEKRRIEAAGGTVEFSGCWRVICRQLYSGLAVARAFGMPSFAPFCYLLLVLPLFCR
jgi:hypothetical protein